MITTRALDSQNWYGLQNSTSWYQYDDVGNRISHKHRANSAIAYAHDNANRMTTMDGKPQGYDNAGNMTLAYSANGASSYVYEYDHNNRLTEIWHKNGATLTLKQTFGYDALGRRIRANPVGWMAEDLYYYYDGLNEVVEYDDNTTRARYYVHGLSYIDERLFMYHDGMDLPIYYVLDNMYNVVALIDRTGAMIERYVYDSYGRPHIRETPWRGDLWFTGQLDSNDGWLIQDTIDDAMWDSRADMDGDVDVDNDDMWLFDFNEDIWSGNPTVSQAYSDMDNPYMWQGRPHFAVDTADNATDPTISLVDHRLRFQDAILGRWTSRDPIAYLAGTMNLYEYALSNGRHFHDPMGLEIVRGNRDFVNPDGTITRHYYETHWTIWAVFGVSAETYVGSYRFDPNDDVEVWIADDYERVIKVKERLKTASKATEVGLYGTMILGSFLVPGPDDVVWWTLLRERGIAVVSRGGIWVLERAGEQLGKRGVSQLLRAYWRAKGLLGQVHHIISKPIAEALARHPNLAGKINREADYFKTVARQLSDHYGYQDWHRELDQEIVAWVKKHKNATLQDFFDELRRIYQREDLARRFPGTKIPPVPPGQPAKCP